MKKYIHIASFAGNVGDIVNHLVFYNATGLNLSCFKRIEIRDFYYNKGNERCLFDERLLEEINFVDMHNNEINISYIQKSSLHQDIAAYI